MYSFVWTCTFITVAHAYPAVLSINIEQKENKNNLQSIYKLFRDTGSTVLMSSLV